MRLPALALGAVALAAASPPGWHTFRGDATSVSYPPGWHATAMPLTPVTAPEQMLAVASYRLPRGPAGADGCRPTEALDRLPATGAFVFGWDYGPLSTTGGLRARDFPPRPKHFGLTGYSRYECLGPSYMVRFRDAGRAFQIHVALGPRASASTRAEVLRVLDSFVARPG